MTTQQRNLDGCGTLETERERRLRVRNALLELLRSIEALWDLPTERPVKRADGAYTNGDHRR